MQHILLVHTGGGLGDVLLSTPLISALKQQFPQADIDYLARSATACAIRNHPELHEVLTLDRAAPSWQELLPLSRRLQEKHYDAALVLWSRTNLALMLRLAGIPIRVGQDSRLSYSWTYTHKVKVRSEHGDEQTHWSEILLDYGRSLGFAGPSPAPLFVVPETAKQKAAALLQELPDSAGNGPLIGLHSGKGMALSPSNWPTTAFAEWAKQLHEQLGARLILTGGPAEQAIVNDVAQKCAFPLLNLAGRTDIDTLAAVCQACQVFVCPDSGPMHLAAVSGTPTVGIYALAEDYPSRWAPLGAPSAIVSPQEPFCQRSQCRKSQCAHRFNCYHRIVSHDVVAAVKKLLATTPLHQ